MPMRCAILTLCLAAGCTDGGDAAADSIRFEVDASGRRSVPRANPAPDPGRSMVVAGHLRGDGAGVAPEFVAALPRLATEASTLVLLGDLTAATSQPKYAALVRRDILDRFPGEVFVAPGNHDVSDRAALNELLGGATYRDARACGGSVALIILDTELDQAGIVGDQLAFFRETARRLEEDDEVDFAFFCFHKFLWFPGSAHFREVYENGLNWTGPELEKAYPPTNFWADLFPPMQSLVAAGKTVFVLGGDFGFRRKSMLAVYEDVLFLGTGIGAERSGNTYLHFALTAGKMVCTERSF